jgi:hypothetical protein
MSGMEGGASTLLGSMVVSFWFEDMLAVRISVESCFIGQQDGEIYGKNSFFKL